MDEVSRVKAIPRLMDWAARDDTAKILVRTVLAHTGQKSIGHLARNLPEQFDELFEETSGIVRNNI